MRTGTEIVNPCIRSKLRDTVADFTGSFTNELSLPSEITVNLNLLLFRNSCNKLRFLLPEKSIAQIIKSRVEKQLKVESEKQTNNRIRTDNRHFYRLKYIFCHKNHYRYPHGLRTQQTHQR